jgi:ASC-1-like (ASCH) protein
MTSTTTDGRTPKVFNGLGVPLWMQQPWLDLSLTGRKTVEGRVMRTNGKSNWKEGDIVLIGTDPDDHDAQQAVVWKIREYSTLHEFLENEWKKAAPHCNTLEEARDAYYRVMTISKGTAEDGVEAGKDICAFDPRRIVARKGMVAVEFQLP